MRQSIVIQDIEEMRRREGIDDVELRAAINRLKIGDFVKLTFLSGTSSVETTLVRITSVRGDCFRGTVERERTSLGLARRRTMASVDFTSAHIHSIGKKEPPP